MDLIVVTEEKFIQIVEKVKKLNKQYFQLPFLIKYAGIERRFRYAELLPNDTIEVETKSGIKLQLISHNRCMTFCRNIIPCEINLKLKNTSNI